MQEQQQENSDSTEEQVRQMLKEQQFIYDHNPANFKLQLGRYPPSTSSALFTFIKQLRPTMDLRRITVPIYLVSPISTLEKFCDTYRPAEQLTTIANQTCPKERIKILLASIIAPLCEAPCDTWYRIKPLNPILGEQFHAWFDHEDGSVTTFTAEQVSHHPPISAFHMENKKAGWVYRLTNEPKAKLGWNSIEVQVQGKTSFHILPLDETYEYYVPTYTATGVFIGAGSYCLSRKLKLKCNKTGYSVKIPFNPNLSISGHLMLNGKPVGQFKGSFRDKLVYIDDDGTEELLVDFVNMPVNPRKVKPVHEQKENESQFVWHHVRYALEHLKDDTVANEKKLQVEEYERSKRAKGEHENFTPELFKVSIEEQGTDDVPIFIRKGFNL